MQVLLEGWSPILRFTASPDPHCLPWDCRGPCDGSGAQLVSKDRKSCSLSHATKLFVHLGKEILGCAACAYNCRKSHFFSFFFFFLFFSGDITAAQLPFSFISTPARNTLPKWPHEGGLAPILPLMSCVLTLANTRRCLHGARK